MNMEERFDSPIMLGSRALLASHLSSGASTHLITEAVPEFFESLAILDRLDYLLPELTYNTFSDYVVMWWFALRDWVAEERVAHGDDLTYFDEFEHFAVRLMDADARKRQISRDALRAESRCP
jgi:hypothetical protein